MKVTALLLTLMLIVTFGFAAVPAMSEVPVEEVVILDETAEENVEEYVEVLMGTLMEITEEGLLMDTGFMGPVLVKLTEETMLDGFETWEELLPGRLIAVDYNGMMSRSSPAQITASRVCSYLLTGVVTELVDNAFVMETEIHGPVQVNIDPEAGLTLPEVNAQVTVTFGGMMTMSIPAQVSAWLVQ